MNQTSHIQPEKGSPFGTFLEGVKILDLSQYIPGPMATLFLADMGASVLKIEPLEGDKMQSLGPKDENGRPIYYRALNAGKIVRHIDLKNVDGRKEFLELLQEADVVVEGFRPGVLTRLGIDYPVLNAVNPRIILCSISGYGAGSSLALKASHDANYLAEMGVMSRNGLQMPLFYDPPISDVAGSLFAATAVLGALYQTKRSGRGCVIDLALADTVMPLQLMQVADYAARGWVPKRGDNYLNGGAAYYQVYATKDNSHITIGAVEPKFWEAFCSAVGRPEWIARQLEPFPQKDLISDVADYIKSLTLGEIVSFLSGVDCCFSVVKDLGESLSDQHIVERRLVRRANNGGLQALFPVWVDGMPPQPRPELVLLPSTSATPPTAQASQLDGRDSTVETEATFKPREENGLGKWQRIIP